jgi:hypothetical protein
MGMFDKKKGTKADTTRPATQPFSEDAIANRAWLSQEMAGSGEIIALRGTGQETMGTPVYEIDLMITVPDREPFQVTHRQMIDSAALGSWRIGTVYPVRVSSSDPSQVLVMSE